jgi:glycerol-3-phosphate O-acyltransferase/dihydroxyacetone phosphate acyltransferase
MPSSSTPKRDDAMAADERDAEQSAEGGKSLRDRLASGLARILIYVFYRRIELTGAERIPSAGPLLVVANHANALIDPILLVAVLDRPIRFLGKSTLWNNPLLRPLLWLGNVIPVFRSQDGGQMAQNEQTFEKCHQELADGGAIALFPEGISYHAPQLQPFKTGAARIALGAEAAHGPLGVRVVPVGLTYESKGIFRSRVLVTVGDEIALTPKALGRGADPDALSEPAGQDESGDADERAAVRALTERIVNGLREVTLNFDSWSDSRLVEHVVEVYAEGESELPGRAHMADRFSLRQRFGDGYQALREQNPERCAALVEGAQRYERWLEELGLRDDHVSARYPGRRIVHYLTTHLTSLLLWLPIAAVGTLLNYLPYRASGWIADRFDEGAKDLPATLKLLSSFVMMPVVWALEIAVAAALWGQWAGVATAVIAPASAYAALHFHEGHRSFWEEVRAYAVMRMRPRRLAELHQLRAEIRAEVEELVGEYGDVAAG